MHPKEFIGSFYTSYRGFELDAKRAVFAATLNSTSRSFSGFILVLYLASLGYGLGEIGLITSIGMWLGAATLLPSGRLADRLGRSRAMACSVCLATVGMLVYMASNSFATFALASATIGVADSIYGPAYSALLSNKVSDKRRNYLFGAERFSTMVGATSAIFVAGFVPDVLNAFGYGLGLGFRIVFAISIVVLLMEIPFLTKIVDPRDEIATLDGGTSETAEVRSSSEIAEVKTSNVAIEPAKKFWPLDADSTKYVVKYAFANGLIAFGAGFVIPFMQLYFMIRFDAPMALIAMVFSITSVLMALSYLFVPKLAERIGSIRTIVFTQGISIFMLVAIPLAYPYFALASLFYLVRTVLMNASSPIGTSYIMGCVKKGERAFAASIFSLSWTLSNGLSPPISGWIMATYNMDIPFYICAAFYAIACGAYYVFFGNEDRR